MKSAIRNFALALGLAMTAAAGSAEAAMAPSVGPKADWTEPQKFEWYLGYMSAASALCHDYDAAKALGDIATLSPYGRIGLNAINFDGFIGGACAKIRKRSKELLQKRETYISILSATYGCSDGGACAGGPEVQTPSHACATQVDEHLDALSLKSRDIAGISFKDDPITGDRRTVYQARVRLKSCSGSLYVDMSKQCALRNSYTRGDCEVDGVSGY